jgi:hypothetical protein
MMNGFFQNFQKTSLDSWQFKSQISMNSLWRKKSYENLLKFKKSIIMQFKIFFNEVQHY